MSTSTSGPVPYTVTYTPRVQQRLRELAAAATARGDGEAFLSALREFDRLLKVYPQFGDPLLDFQVHPGQLRLGVVPPLSMRYAVLEDQRVVFVAALPVLLRRAG